MDPKSSTTTASDQQVEYLDDELENLANSLLEKHHVPGLSIAIVDNGRVSMKGYGMARLPDIPATQDTLYYVGSTTKAMVAAAAGTLIHGEKDESNPLLGLLQENKWATTIKSILAEDFHLEDDYATAHITFEDALSHRTGLAGADYIYGSWMTKDPKEVVKALRHLGPLHRPFRTSWQYNNLMYSVVGDALKAITNLDCGAMLKKLLWDPLKMTSTFWRLEHIPKGEQRNHLARGYFWVPSMGKEDGSYVPEPYLEFAGISPAGAAISSVRDFAKWIQELLRAAKKGDASQSDELTKPLITHDLFKDLTTPRTIMLEPPMGKQNQHLSHRAYALGWILSPPVAGIDHPIVVHAGGLTGFGSQLYLAPNDDFGVVTLGNTSLTSNIVGDALCLNIIARKLGLSNEARTKFVEAIISKLPPAALPNEEASLENKRPKLDQEESLQVAAKTISTPDGRVEQFLQTIVGEYHHPAFGSFHVSKYNNPDDTNHNKPVLYMPWTPYADREKHDEQRRRSTCLQVTPSGQRTWKYQLLLHTRPELVHTLASLASLADVRKDYSALLFDLETLNGHGNVEDDALPGLATGCEDFKGGSKSGGHNLRSEVFWHSRCWTQYGAALQLDRRSSESTEIESSHYALGIRLANGLMDTDGDNKAGWENKMIWFTKK